MDNIYNFHKTGWNDTTIWIVTRRDLWTLYDGLSEGKPTSVP